MSWAKNDDGFEQNEFGLTREEWAQHCIYFNEWIDRSEK